MLPEAKTRGTAAALERYKLANLDPHSAAAQYITSRGYEMPAQALEAALAHPDYGPHAFAPTGAELAHPDAPTFKGRKVLTPQELETLGATPMKGMGAWSKRLLSGQGAHARNLYHGLRNIGNAGGRRMVSTALPGLMPSAGIAAGGYLLYNLLKDRKNRGVPDDYAGQTPY